MRIIQLSDIHLTSDREATLFGISSYHHFEQIIEEINQVLQIKSADLIIVSGDITHDCGPATYRYFLQAMESLKTPYLVIPGNHDILENLHQATATESLHYMLSAQEYSAAGWYIAAVDTVVTGEDYGFIPPERLAALEKKLPASTNIALFMHHHPLPVGTPIVDQCRLTHPQGLLSLCEKHQVKFIGCGHAHTPCVKKHLGTTISVAPAVSFQWLPGTETVAISKGFGFSIIELADNISVNNCIY